MHPNKGKEASLKRAVYYMIPAVILKMAKLQKQLKKKNGCQGLGMRQED